MKQELTTLANVDIRAFPKEKIINPLMTDITIGDLHANPLLLLNHLVRRGIVDISPENYEAFAKIYTLPKLQPKLGNVYTSEKAPIFSADNKKEDLENIYAQFNQIVGQITVIDKKTLFRLIGDELVDRGMSDYFVLKLLQRLDKQGANFEIIPSNHGIEFVEACEKFAQNGNKLVAARIKNVAHGNSFVALQESIEAGAIKAEEILDIYNQSYKKHLKLISYSLDKEGNEIHIFSHAGIGLNHIRGLAEKFGVPYSARNAADLAKTIDNINKQFALKVDANEVHTLYSDEMMYRGYTSKAKYNVKDEVIAAILWGRVYSDLERESTDFIVKFIHGHDDGDRDQTHLTLNEKLGQFANYRGDLKFYSTDGQHEAPTNYLEEISILKQKVNLLQTEVDELKTTNSALEKTHSHLNARLSEATRLLVANVKQHLATKDERDQLNSQNDALQREIGQLKQENAQLKIDSDKAVQEQKSLANEQRRIVAELLTIKELDCANLIATKLIPSSTTYFLHLVEEAKQLDSSVRIKDYHQDFPTFKGEVADKERYEKIGEKYKAMQRLLLALTDTKNNPLPSERITKFSESLANHNAQIKEYRDSAWIHYSKSCAIAIGIVCTGIIPGIIALLAYSSYKGKSSSLFFVKSIGEEYVDTMDASLLNSPISVGAG
ncbi:hypothetical protein BN59_01246 [Legionella massiliensis]|uniref:WipA-like phosphatase domain-containing protein n=1 Tax=Legionella massiliensis TaxID=1034943 RepID=A0A078KVF6_9GAMM|nr:Dot/Icm T4SS effector Wip [Legionella massiliensis]CDZ76967.1 hypothetical protein BN59_01246 [Legionella massiliensis]CEE12705.1 hypothetical protein BN1094_01246 [Legionella massiliensis]